MKYSIGLGLTDRCNLRCPHCYSRPRDGSTALPADSVRRLCKSLDIRSVNLGTGESGLHREFLETVKGIREEGIDVALTTNGYTVVRLSHQELRLFHDIVFSLDFPSQAENDSWRGNGSFQSVQTGIRRCQEAGVEVSVACCMMNRNYNRMDEMVELCARLGANLRINVYKPVHTDAYKMTYSQFWGGISQLLSHSRLVSCSEPIVNALIGNRTSKASSPCGRASFRIRPTGEVIPCVYWKNTGVFVDDILSEADGKLDRLIEEQHLHYVPDICRSCQWVDLCGGGCAGRRLYHSLSQPDEYCFALRGDVPEIKYTWDDRNKDLVHSSYLCTIIVSP